MCKTQDLSVSSGKIFLIFLLAVPTAFFPACVDEIALDVPDNELSKLAIEGRLTLGDPSFAYVILSRTGNFSENSFAEAVNGATVIIQGEAGGAVQLDPVGPGRYEAEVGGISGLAVTTGTAYRLEVLTPDGQHYTSTWEDLYAVPKADSLTYALITKEVINAAGNLVEENYVEFRVTTPLLPPGGSDPARLIWNFEGCFQLSETPRSVFGIPQESTCYITQKLDLEKVALFDGSTLNGEKLAFYPLLQEVVNHRFSKSLYLTAYQRSLSPGAFQYWSQVGQIVERNGGLFETPPGPVFSNLSNVNDPGERVLGYFSCEAVDTVRVKVNLVGDIRPIPFCLLPDAEDFPYCENCLLWPGSTLEKPEYWVD